MPEAPIRVAVVMACYNRRETTLRCLRSLKAQIVAGVAFDIHLLDDASRDGTAAAVISEFGDVHIIPGDGNYFWGGGMHAAMQSALKSDFDYMLWLNDDVELRPGALESLIAAHARAIAENGDGLHVLSGAVADPATGQLTYSGFNRRNRWHPAQLTRVPPMPDKLTRCDTLNGNCVLVPKAVVECIGLIDPVFIQQLGDIDYGYRVRRAGGSLWLAPDFVGTCAPNLGSSRPKGFRNRLRQLFSPHGLPPRPWATFMWRYSGVMGLALLGLIYAKSILRTPR